MLKSLGVEYLNDYPLGSLRSRMDGDTPPRYEVAPIEKLSNERFEVWVVPARSGAVVRWRDVQTGRDWLRGFDDIRSPWDRLQDWADTGPHPTADPYPVDQRYSMVERGPDRIVLETTLDNGLHVLRIVSLVDDGIETSVRITNSSAEPITPKFAVALDLSERGARRPALWRDQDGEWTRAHWDRQDGIQSTTLRSGAAALRYPDRSRTLTVEHVAGASDETRISRSPHGDSCLIVTHMDAAELAAGAHREMTVRHSIVVPPPRGLDRVRSR
jgi:hypothetical protein